MPEARYVTEQDMKDRVGQIGTDALGMRFVVLDSRNINEGTRHEYVAVLPGGRSGTAGVCLHYSWPEMPVTWETP